MEPSLLSVNSSRPKTVNTPNSTAPWGKKFQLAGPVSEVLGVGTMVIILIVGGGMVLGDTSELSASQFIAFLIIFSQVLPPAKALSQAHGLMQRGVASAKRVFELIDHDERISDSSNKELRRFESSIEFSNVSYAYGEERVLSNINLAFERGKTYAVVGPSGSGKSTLVDLISRFHDPVEGVILLDGSDIRSYRLDDLRSLIAVVSQDTVLFHDTIRNNITFGDKGISTEAVNQAIKLANANEFIEVMPEGLETVVGERGSRLSGGERQRIAIARAVLKNAPILILDEATSALDLSTEDLVKDAVARLMVDKTTIIISHRMSSISHADTVIRLENGRIVEDRSLKKGKPIAIN